LCATLFYIVSTRWFMTGHPIPSSKGHGFHRAIHLRVSESEAAGLAAHALKLARKRNAPVSLSEAVRDLLGQALGREQEQPWEAALKGLPFVEWNGGKPGLPALEQGPEGKSLAEIILEDRGEH
jgi:hypothetical protein